MRNQDAPSQYPCVICGQSFAYGPHRYDGRPVKSWKDVMVCKRCEAANWDGLVPRSGWLHRLNEAGVDTENLSKNDKGWIPIPP